MPVRWKETQIILPLPKSLHNPIKNDPPLRNFTEKICSFAVLETHTITNVKVSKGYRLLPNESDEPLTPNVCRYLIREEHPGLSYFQVLSETEASKIAIRLEVTDTLQISVFSNDFSKGRLTITAKIKQ